MEGDKGYFNFLFYQPFRNVTAHIQGTGCIAFLQKGFVDCLSCPERNLPLTGDAPHQHTHLLFLKGLILHLLTAKTPQSLFRNLHSLPRLAGRNLHYGSPTTLTSLSREMDFSS